MQITVEKTDGCKCVIKAEIPATMVSEKLAEGYRDINKQVQFPGFRKGKAPRKMLEKRFGSDIQNDVRQNLADEVVRKAIDEHELKLLGQVDVVDASELTGKEPSNFTLEAEIYPEFELPKYKGLELKRPAPKVEEHEIHATMRSAQIEKGELKTKEGESSAEDFIRANLRVVVGEEEIFNQPRGLLEAGYEWIAGLQPADAKKLLVGVKAGDSIETKADLPEDFGRDEFAGKEADLQIEVIEVLEAEAPAMEEIWKELQIESEDAWRKKIEEDLLSRKDSEIDRLVEEQALDKVVKDTDMTLPEKFSEKKAADFIQQQAYRMYQQGMPDEEVKAYIDNNKGKGVDEVKGMLKRNFVLDAISKKERLVVTEDEISRKVQELANNIGRSVEELKTILEQQGTIDGMREELKTAKVMKLLRTKGKYVDKSDAAE
ncbi:MAG: trigger factor [Planctomycetota bacterium]|jgi:trigger factor